MDKHVQHRTIREVFIQKVNIWKKDIALWMNKKTSPFGRSTWQFLLICFIGCSTAYNIQVLVGSIIIDNSGIETFKKDVKNTLPILNKEKKHSSDSIDINYQKYMNAKK